MKTNALKNTIIAAFFLLSVAFAKAEFRVATGTYTGDGGATQAITNLGFAPKAGTIWENAATGPQTRISGMAANTSVAPGGGSSTTSLQSLDADGFTVGSSFNTNTTTYYYTMWGGSNVDTGSYIGNGVDNTAQAVGLDPVWVFIISSRGTAFRGGSPAGDLSRDEGATGFIADCIQSLGTAQFEVGTNDNCNVATGSPTYYFWATDAGASFFKNTTYAGNGTDNRSISGAGFTPEFLLVAADASERAVLRSDDMIGDASKSYLNEAFTANKIQAIEADGFQVGTSGEVNTNLVNYYYYAFKDEGAPAGGAGNKQLLLGVGP